MTEKDEGIVLGRHYDEAAQSAGDAISYKGERHLLLFGPNGTGKGTRFLIPNLLTIKDRSIVVDRSEGRTGRRHRRLSPHRQRSHHAQSL